MYMVSTSNGLDEHALPHWFGLMTSPRAGNRASIERGDRPWCMDNDVFTNHFNPNTFRAALDKYAPHANTCLFVAAPDVISDATATLTRWPEWQHEITTRGYPAALVAQDGLTPDRIPANADALFIGGSTTWKLSVEAQALITAAKARGLWTHVGRVNSQKRIRHFALAGADSVDGTFHAFASIPGLLRRLGPALAEEPIWRGL